LLIESAPWYEREALGEALKHRASFMRIRATEEAVDEGKDRHGVVPVWHHGRCCSTDDMLD